MKKIKNIGRYIEKAKDKDDLFRLMGFGHRVYKHYVPSKSDAKNLSRSA